MKFRLCRLNKTEFKEGRWDFHFQTSEDFDDIKLKNKPMPVGLVVTQPYEASEIFALFAQTSTEAL